MKHEFFFKISPRAKQSARFAKVGKFMRSYTSKKTRDYEKNLSLQALSQFKEKPLAGALKVNVSFRFAPLSNFPKYKLNMLEKGEIIYKTTKPDLTDNLCKALFDALEGIVFLNDSQICDVKSEKIFSMEPGIKLMIEEIL